MNLPTCCRILGITQTRLAEKMRITPRALRYRLAKAGEPWDKSHYDVRTLDIFTHKTKYENALAQFDYILHDFMHRTGRKCVKLNNPGPKPAKRRPKHRPFVE